MKIIIATILWLGFALGSGSITNAQQIKSNDPNSFRPGWYFGVNSGLDWHIAEGNFPTNDHLIYFSLQKCSGFIGHALIGYDINSIIGLRGQFGYVDHNWADIRYQTPAGPYKMVNFKSENISADFLVNLVNWWVGYRPKQVFDISVFAGLGMEHRDKASFTKDWFGAVGRVGAQSNFHVLPKVDLVLMFDVSMVGDNYNEYVRSFPLEGYPALTLGLNFK